MRFAELKQVIVGEVPLAVAGPVKDCDRPVRKCSHHAAFNMTVEG